MALLAGIHRKRNFSARGLISPNDLRLYKITDNIDEGVHEVCHFYSNYHSLRYVRDDLVMRLHRRPTAGQLAEIETQFSDIKVKGVFQVMRRFARRGR